MTSLISLLKLSFIVHFCQSWRVARTTLRDVTYTRILCEFTSTTEKEYIDSFVWVWKSTTHCTVKARLWWNLLNQSDNANQFSASNHILCSEPRDQPQPGSFSPSRRERKRAWERGCWDATRKFFTLVTNWSSRFPGFSSLNCLRLLLSRFTRDVINVMLVDVYKTLLLKFFRYRINKHGRDVKWQSEIDLLVRQRKAQHLLCILVSTLA
jgi:hypothetical protein